LYTVKEKGGKPVRKPYLLPYGLRNPYRNLKSDNAQDYTQKPQRNCTFVDSASVHCSLILSLHFNKNSKISLSPKAVVRN
jgi:hypothetical protein